MFSVDQIIQEQFPVLGNSPPVFATMLSRLLRLILKERDFQLFAQEYPHLQGMDFVEQVLSYFDFSYQVRLNERERIPASGSVVIVANHPIGSLDGLALLKLVHEIRPDVKVVANNFLQKLQPLQSMLLPVNNFSGMTARRNIRDIHTHLQRGAALIIFPAGEVSRLAAQGIRDGEWSVGFIKMASAGNAPVVPVFVDGRNSPLFYGLSVVYRPLSTLWLVREMFKQQNRTIGLRIGEPVPHRVYASLPLSQKAVAKLFRKQVYRLSHNKAPLIKTEKAIALPENRQSLRGDIRRGERLGETRDGKSIWLLEYRPDSPVMREIARLREVSFRAVGEGSGKPRDRDRYDMHYQHMVLWDDDELEIAGAYRWCASADSDCSKLYTSGLFRFGEGMKPVVRAGLELGRSFVQPMYWGRRSLDYLWNGIGAFLRTRPDIRYLFGPVSISGSYPPLAMAMIVHHYKQHYSPAVSAGLAQDAATAQLPYRVPQEYAQTLSTLMPGENERDDFCVLKEQLQQMGLAIPTLYKQYTELCEEDGVWFLDFNIDPDFSNCVDGLVVVDLHKVKPAKLQRYMGVRQSGEAA